MTVLAGLVGMVGVLLGAGGASKARQPLPTVTSFRALHLPASSAAVRALAGVEIALGAVLVVVAGRWPSALGALIFAAFTVLSARLVQLGPAAGSCGCFGERSARPSWWHVGIDAVAALVLAVGAITDTTGVAHHWRSLPGDGFVVLGLVGLGGYLLVALMTVLPDTLDAMAGRDAPADRLEFGLTGRPR
ncbi:MAG TPA: MauE/DoxX family redox-associated membrane protein [Acidimicrobiales bacterium]|nr:MauE/DoxX family redox-associated membrane protein [Acidimicrobiales bacterium]